MKTNQTTVDIQNITELPEYIQQYILELKPLSDFENDTVDNALGITFQETIDLFSEIYSTQKDYAYEPGKWTIAEVIGHLIDVERIFSYRALRIARGDKENQPGFDENEYANRSHYDLRDWDSLKQELLVLMESTGYLFENMNQTELSELGLSNQVPMTPRTIGFLTAAHRWHHINIIKNRYLTY